MIRWSVASRLQSEHLVKAIAIAAALVALATYGTRMVLAMMPS